MVPLKAAGTVRLQNSDPQRTATALAHVFRGLGFEVRQHDAQVWLVNRHSTFVPSRELASIAGAEVSLTADAGRTSAHYVLTLPRTFLILPAVLPIGASIVFWQDSARLALAVFAFFLGLGMCWVGVYLAKEGFEEWIQRVSWRASEPAAVHDASEVTAARDAGQAAAIQILQQHKRTTLRWQTALAVALPLGFLLVAAMFALQFRAESRARVRLRNELAHVTGQSEVIINGRRLTQSDTFLQIIQGVRHMEAHHSSPVRPLPVIVRSAGQTVSFVVGQDSERADEFWLVVEGQEVGRIRDSRLRPILSTVASDIR